MICIYNIIHIIVYYIELFAYDVLLQIPNVSIKIKIYTKHYR